MTADKNDPANAKNQAAMQDQELQQLRQLLLASEQARITELEALVQAQAARIETLSDPARRAEQVSEVFTQALQRNYQNNPKFAQAMAQPVADALHSSVKNSPEPLADALFPVINPAIRKSISNALREFSASLGEMLEYSVSPKGLRWRVEAWRSGIPFAELVLSKTLVYQVEQAFLIANSTGLKIAQESANVDSALDEDAVAAMLTALQAFARDSLRAMPEDSLETLQVGEKTLWITRGPHAYLACVIRGNPPRDYRESMQDCIEAIHADFGNDLDSKAGDPTAFPGLEFHLQDCLQRELKRNGDNATDNNAAPAESNDKKETSGLNWPVALAMCALLGLLGWYGFNVWQAQEQAMKIEQLITDLSAQPGIIILDSSKHGSQWKIRLLQDPAIPSQRFRIRRAGLDPNVVQIKSYPFSSPGLNAPIDGISYPSSHTD